MVFMKTYNQGLKTQGYNREIQSVPYEFQRGGNQMLRVGEFFELG